MSIEIPARSIQPVRLSYGKKDFKFDTKSVQADNSSSVRFVTGGRMLPVQDLDLKTIGVVMEKNGEVVEMGAGAAVLGHPAAVPVDMGDCITVRYQDLGTVTMRFVE